MKYAIRIIFWLFTMGKMEAQSSASPVLFDMNAAGRFANLALACVHKQYPNKISHSLNSDADVAPPRKLTPAFYGCYDWHSSVHGHWLLARLVRTFPNAGFAASAREALRQSLTADNIAQEAVYLRAEGRASFERPYGLGRLEDWLPKLSYPVRIGEHAQTSFALGLMFDYAHAAGDTKFADLLASRAR